MSKFKAGDKVFWIWQEAGELELHHCIVISEQRAKKFYKGGPETDLSVESCHKKAKEEDNSVAVFLVDPDNNNRSIGWMPENKLYPLTKAALVLYGSKDDFPNR